VFHPNPSSDDDTLRKQISDSVAYASFLAWNHPSRSWRVMRFLLEGAFRSRRWWHTSWRSEMSSLSVTERIASGMYGFFVFCRSQRKSK
jgi:hypothetical protein